MHSETIDTKDEDNGANGPGGDRTPDAQGDTQAAADVVEEAQSKDLEAELEEWRAKADEYLDKYRRSVAEFANYRKRQERERPQESLRIRMSVLGQFLPIVDDLERALDHVPEDQLEIGWVQGVTLIEKKVKKLLESLGVVPIEAVGKPFDPEFHSGLMKEESDVYPANTVTEEVQRGYLIDGKVLRAAMVKISLGSGLDSDGGAAGTGVSPSGTDHE
jgi:molecular chaperone GrpE